jgi:hypothetical protein
MPHTHFSKAHEQYVIAKHLLHTTLPLVKDPKLLIGITHNMYDSMTHASNILTKSPSIPVKTVKISEVHQKFGKQFDELHRTIQSYKKSPVVFRRQENFIICSPDYEIEPITKQRVQGQLNVLKEFLMEISAIINRKD